MELNDILSQMADYTTDAVIITKAEDCKAVIDGPEIVYVNKSFTALTGYTAEEAVGRTLNLFTRSKNRQKNLMARISQAIVDMRPSVSVECLNYSKEGHEYWVEINLNPIICPKTGECVYFLATERDITERKTAESQLMKAIEKAEEATKGKK
jgi:PAS domain S-box-containing protein